MLLGRVTALSIFRVSDSRPFAFFVGTQLFFSRRSFFALLGLVRKQGIIVQSFMGYDSCDGGLEESIESRECMFSIRVQPVV